MDSPLALQKQKSESESGWMTTHRAHIKQDTITHLHFNFIGTGFSKPKKQLFIQIQAPTIRKTVGVVLPDSRITYSVATSLSTILLTSDTGGSCRQQWSLQFITAKTVTANGSSAGLIRARDL